MVFRVTDDGPGFDFDNIPDPTSPENLEKPNGRGVFLMRSLADVCDFEELGRVAVLRFKDVVSISVQG
jgi:serine/threonine-protein kinase RsbW